MTISRRRGRLAPLRSTATATAETSSRLSPVNCTTPASFRFAAAARSARQAIGRPPPALAGPRSAFLPTARHAPLSHNGPWWVVATRFEGVHPLPTTTIMRSGLRFAPLGGGFTHTPSSIVHGVGAALARAGKLPPRRPARPWPRRRGHHQGSPPALWPHAEEAGIAGEISPPYRSD